MREQARNAEGKAEIKCMIMTQLGWAYTFVYHNRRKKCWFLRKSDVSTLWPISYVRFDLKE